jgi:hypothetical protein
MEAVFLLIAGGATERELATQMRTWALLAAAAQASCGHPIPATPCGHPRPNPRKPRHAPATHKPTPVNFGAGEGIRTLDPNLGKRQIALFWEFKRLEGRKPE